MSCLLCVCVHLLVHVDAFLHTPACFAQRIVFVALKMLKCLSRCHYSRQWVPPDNANQAHSLLHHDLCVCVLCRYGGSKLERARDLFETALRDAPPEKAKPLFLEYAALEEQHGLARHAMEVSYTV